jgi:hypothetical protein
MSSVRPTSVPAASTPSHPPSATPRWKTSWRSWPSTVLGPRSWSRSTSTTTTSATCCEPILDSSPPSPSPTPPSRAAVMPASARTTCASTPTADPPSTTPSRPAHGRSCSGSAAAPTCGSCSPASTRCHARNRPTPTSARHGPAPFPAPPTRQGTLTPDLSTNAEQMPRSGIRRIMDLAWSLGQPVIGLHVGEPSFAPPDHVRKAAEDALQRGETRYVPNAGITPLRHAISNKVARHNGISASPEQVIVSAGGMQALYVALSATVQSGDEVLIPDPAWPTPTTSGSSPTSATTPSPSTYRTAVPRSTTSSTGSSAASASPRRTP